jgi:LDH2 family malate/lactate/ureidoglycolate dehydrogenase
MDPKQTVGLKKFKKENSELMKRIKSTRKLKGQKVRIPGEQASKLQAERLKRGSIDIPAELWHEIQAL